jgi:hypothetical protein
MGGVVGISADSFGVEKSSRVHVVDVELAMGLPSYEVERTSVESR